MKVRMDPAYPAVTLTTCVRTAGSDRSRWAGQVDVIVFRDAPPTHGPEANFTRRVFRSRRAREENPPTSHERCTRAEALPHELVRRHTSCEFDYFSVSSKAQIAPAALPSD